MPHRSLYVPLSVWYVTVVSVWFTTRLPGIGVMCLRISIVRDPFAFHRKYCYGIALRLPVTVHVRYTTAVQVSCRIYLCIRFGTVSVREPILWVYDNLSVCWYWQRISRSVRVTIRSLCIRIGPLLLRASTLARYRSLSVISVGMESLCSTCISVYGMSVYRYQYMSIVCQKISAVSYME